MREDNDLSLSDLSDSTIIRENESLLSLLLKDHTTGKNIKWGTDSYINHGYSFRNDQEIKIDLITGWYEGFIRPRVDKDIDIQLERQRNRAEVFTPSWVIKLQVDAALEDMEKLPLADFIQTKWLEIACGEAPYMTNRYEMTTGNVIPLKERSGFIDIKFKKINEHVDSEDEWMKLVLEIYKSSYGYEYQGDSLLLARENLLLTFVDNYFYMFGAFPNDNLLQEVAKVVSFNVIQMDGLTYEIPYSDGGAKEYGTQLSLFEEIEEKEETPKLAKIKIGKTNNLITFKTLKDRNDIDMKFDVIIGNPPYQMSDGGGTGDSSTPVYDKFMTACVSLNPNLISLITPSRWMKGGKGLQKFRETMISDTRIRYIEDYEDAKRVFPNNNIDGGVSFFVWDNNYDGKVSYEYISKSGEVVLSKRYLAGVTDTVIRDPRQYTIIEKALRDEDELFSTIVSPRKPFGLNSDLFNRPEKYKEMDIKESYMKDYVKVYGVKGIKGGSKRIAGYVRQEDVVRNHNDIDKYKLFFSKAFMTTSTVPPKVIMGEPGTACTETFLQIGSYDSNIEMVNTLKYIKTKFFRALLFYNRHSLNISRNSFDLIPLQNFTTSSDIDWSKSKHEIDKQLYKKYKLNENEIAFVETSIEEME